MEANPQIRAVRANPERFAGGRGWSSHHKKRGFDTREAGLAIGLLAGKYLLGMNHLHYGIWPPGLPVKLSNLGVAQQNFADFVLEHVPATVSSILDVGCGTGALADQLLSAGYKVDCVCPNPALVRDARKRLKDRSQIYECPFEALETERRYDLFLFSESFQYIRTYKCLEKILQLARPGSLVLLCDFFKTDAPGECVIGGGPNLREFYELIARYRCFEKLKDIDITYRIAPTMDVVNNSLEPVAMIWKGVRWLAGGENWPLVALFGKNIAARLTKVERKYFSGLRTAQHFSTYKSYRLMMFRVAW